MSEFKIKVGVELDSSDLEGKLKALGKDQEIKLKVDSSDLDKIETQLKGLKKSFQDAFKIDGTALSEVKKIANIFEKIGKMPNLPNPPGSPNKPKSEISSLVSEYKDLYNTISKLQKQIDSGKLGEDSITRVRSKIGDLSSELNQLYLKANDNQRKSLDLFNTKQMNKGIVDMNNYLNKIDLQASNIKKSIGNIDIGKLSSSSKNQLNDVLQIVEKIQAEAKDIKIDIDVGDSLKQLNEAQDTVSKIQKESKKASKGGFFNNIFGDKDDFLGNFSQFKLLDMAGDFIASGISQMASAWKDTVIQTDAAMTDLRKVYEGNLTGDNLKGYLNDVTEVAKGTGKTSVDVIQGTAKAVQSGISDLDNALVFARQSAIFSNVGDVTQEQADTTLSAIMSAYGGVENSLKPVHEQIKGAGKDYNTLTKFMDLANNIA